MIMEINKIIELLKKYDGPQIKLMEVCGTHTQGIAKNGIRSLISPKIKLISGPGCPVCVTPTSYIDKCIEYALKEGHVLLTFGDMMKVPGASESLSEAKGRGARVELMYSPFEAIEKASQNAETTYVIAAVGFETTAPAYALLLKEAKEKGIRNIKILSAPE
jgi:hydrogenase expression/formation protein HypD